MRDWPLHLGCFRERREKTQKKKRNQRLEKSLELRKGRGMREEKGQRAQHRREEVAGKVEGQEMIRNNTSA